MSKQAIEGKRINAFEIEPEQPITICKDTRHKLGEHPLADKRAFLPVRRDVVNSMKIHGWKGGVIVLRKERISADMIVKKERINEDGEYLVTVDGRGRLAAARVANEENEFEGSPVRTRPIVMLEKAEDGDVATTMALLNEMHLEDDILEKGRKALQLLKYGKSRPEVAASFGVTVQAIEQWIKIPTECAAEVIQAIEQKQIAPSVALELAALPRTTQVEEFEKLKAAGQLTVARAKEATFRAKPSNAAGGKKLPLAAVRRICKLVEKGKLEAELDPMALKVLQCLTGEIDPRSIKGMSAALREAGFGAKE